MEQLTIPFERFSFDDLSESQKSLVTLAKQALTQAHAPYSQFHVGCTVECHTGKVVTGNNQENAAYPSGLCAERVALFKFKSESKEPIRQMAVVAQNAAGKPANAFCCGACRQVIMEYASMQAEPICIVMGSSEGTFILLEDARMLLPFGFVPDSLL